MKVWMLVYNHNYSETLLGIFSTKEKALDFLEERCGMKPKFEEDTDYWCPIDDALWEQIWAGTMAEPDCGIYRLIDIETDAPLNITLYAE